MIWNVVLLLILSLSACSCPSAYSDRPDFEMYRSISTKNQRHFYKLGLTCFMVGGSDIGPLHNTIAGFRTSKYRFTSVEEARPFFCRFVQEFIKPFNEERTLRPYMRNFPFTEYNFELYIAFMSETLDPFLRPYISSIHLMDGNIVYYQDKSTVLFKESFADAEKLVATHKI